MSSTTWSGGSPPSFSDRSIEPRERNRRTTDLAGRVDDRVEHGVVAARHEVVVVEHARAAARRELGDADARRPRARLRPRGGPTPDTARQPAEQIAADRPAAGHPLEEVMMRVDQPGRDDRAVAIDDVIVRLGARRNRRRRCGRPRSRRRPVRAPRSTVRLTNVLRSGRRERDVLRTDRDPRELETRRGAHRGGNRRGRRDRRRLADALRSERRAGFGFLDQRRDRARPACRARSASGSR